MFVMPVDCGCNVASQMWYMDSHTQLKVWIQLEQQYFIELLKLLLKLISLFFNIEG